VKTPEATRRTPEAARPGVKTPEATRRTPEAARPGVKTPEATRKTPEAARPGVKTPEATRGRMDPRHARGYAGEQGMGSMHYRQEDGWIFFEGPGGSRGHRVTQSGFDGVAYNVRTGESEIHLIDNKSLGRTGNVRSATSIDPSHNLGQNLHKLIQRVEAARDVPDRVRLLERLTAAEASLAAGKPLPTDVKLIVTSVGGRTTDVSQRLKDAGVQHRPQVKIPGGEAPEVKTEPKGPPVNERGEVIGSKAEGATAKMEAAEGKARAVKPDFGGVARGAALIGLGIVAGLLDSWVRDKAIQSQLKQGFEKLNPEIKAKVGALGTDAAALQAEKSGGQIYARVTVQVKVLHELDDAGGDGTAWQYKPMAGFVQLSSVSLSTESIDTVKDEVPETGFAHYYQVKTITYSIPVSVQQPGDPVS
jgi:hypothetical protein